MHCGACAGHVRVLEALDNANACLFPTNALGETPLRLADLRRNDTKKAAVYLAAAATKSGIAESEWRGSPRKAIAPPSYTSVEALDANAVTRYLLRLFPVWRKACALRSNGIATVFCKEPLSAMDESKLASRDELLGLGIGEPQQRTRWSYESLWPSASEAYAVLLGLLGRLEDELSEGKQRAHRLRLAEHMDAHVAQDPDNRDACSLRDMLWASTAGSPKEALACLGHLVREGNLSGVKTLIAHFPEFNKLPQLGSLENGRETPLKHALSLGHWGIVEKLLEAGFSLTEAEAA